jgi:hypothetical protein
MDLHEEGPKLLKIAKEGRLNTIETYVFWNAHEPEPGKVTDKKVNREIQSDANAAAHVLLVNAVQFRRQERHDQVPQADPGPQHVRRRAHRALHPGRMESWVC